MFVVGVVVLFASKVFCSLSLTVYVFVCCFVLIFCVCRRVVVCLDVVWFCFMCDLCSCCLCVYIVPCCVYIVLLCVVFVCGLSCFRGVYVLVLVFTKLRSFVCVVFVFVSSCAYFVVCVRMSCFVFRVVCDFMFGVCFLACLFVVRCLCVYRFLVCVCLCCCFLV